ncbi:MAG: hypothetical protein ACHQX0_05125 [Desulfobaccales bacterium]
MAQSISQIRKALAAAILAAAGVLVSAAQVHALGQADYIAAVAAAVVAGLGVYFVPNSPATAPIPPAPAKVGP